MLNIQALLEIADEFDRHGHPDLADRIERVLRIAAASDIAIKYEVDLSRPYDKEEEQRRIAIEYGHLYKMYLQVLPKIDYLKPFFDTIKAALDTAQVVIKSHIAEKTPAFDYPKFKKFFDHINEVRSKLSNWQSKDMSGTRVLMERQLILSPIKDLAQRMSSLYEDDDDLQAIEEQLKTIINVFENIFDQTTAQIANIPLARD